MAERKYNQLLAPAEPGPPPVTNDQMLGMKFDNQHFSRYYNQCRGRGLSHDQCKDIPVDLRNTAPHPEQVSSGDIAGYMDAMTKFGDNAKCQEFADALHKKMNPEVEKKGMFGQASDFASKAGYSLLWVPVLYGVTRVIKFK